MSSNTINNPGSGSQFNNTGTGPQNNYIDYQNQDHKCLQDLRLSDPRDDKTRIKSTKGGLYREASDWILSHDDYLKWKNDDARLLWIKGDPGKGKTMLLITIIEELERQLEHPEQPERATVLSYFFCQGTNQDLNNATAVLRGLIYLLVKRQTKLITYLRKGYDHAGSKFFQDINSFFALSKVLDAILLDESLSKVYLIVDALDECEIDQRELLDLIQRHTAVSPHIHWIVSSRNKPEIEQYLTTDGSKLKLGLEITGNAEQVSRSIGAYIDKKIFELQLLQEEYDLSEIRNILREKAKGTFLWVSLVVEELHKANSWDIMEVVQEMPPTLEALFTRMMGQIQKLQRRNPELCRLVLSTVIITYRPLHLTELGALSNLPKAITANFLAIRKLVALCGSFLTIQNDFVYVIHQSAQDYLRNTATAILFPNGHTDVHWSIFSRSLYAMQGTLKRDIYDLRQPGLFIDDIKIPTPDPLLAVRYSCVYWTSHYCDIYSDIQDKPDGDLVDQFIRQLYLYWLEALGLIRHLGHAVLSLARLRNLLREQSSDQRLLDLIQDSYRFLLQNRWVIENAPLQTYVSALIFSPTESQIRKLFSNEEPGWIRIKPMVDKTWSPCQQTLEGHGDLINSVAFSPDCKLIASGSADHTVKIWNAATGALQQTLEVHSLRVTSVAFSPDSKLVASGFEDNTVKIWDASTGALQQTLKGHSDLVKAVAFSPDSKLVVSGSTDNTVKIWDASTGALQQTLKWYSDSVGPVAFSPDSKLVASGSEDNTVKIWDTATGALQQTLEEYSLWATSVAFSPDSKLVASGSYDSTVKIWDASTGALQQSLKGHSHLVTSVAFSPDYKLIASSSADHTVKIWNAATGALQQTLEGHSLWATSVAFSPDSKLVASGSYDSTVKIWDASTGALQQTLQQTLKGYTDSVGAVAFSPDSKLVASGSADYTVKIWNVATGALQQTLEVHSLRVTSVAFSPDFKLVASGSEDNTVKIWDASTGALQQTLQQTLKGYSHSVEAVAFSPDSKLVASGSTDNTVKIWDASTGALQQILEGQGYWVTSIFSSSGSAPDQIKPHSYGINSDSSWVSWNSQKVLWLPPDYRRSTSAISLLTSPSMTSIIKIALGMLSGRVIIIGFLDSGPNEHR